jgi:hypothetical protein
MYNVNNICMCICVLCIYVYAYIALVIYHVSLVSEWDTLYTFSAGGRYRRPRSEIAEKCEHLWSSCMLETTQLEFRSDSPWCVSAGSSWRQCALPNTFAAAGSPLTQRCAINRVSWLCWLCWLVIAFPIGWTRGSVNRTCLGLQMSRK